MYDFDFDFGGRRRKHKHKDVEAPLDAPSHSPDWFLERYRAHAIRARETGPDACRSFADKLLEVIARPDMLFAAYLHCLRYGGRAAGPDTISIDELSESQVWSICRLAGRCIRDGTYRPALPRTQRIKKIGGPGFREITLFNVADRIVARAVVQVLDPFLDWRLSDCCFARPRRGTLAAIAEAARLTSEGRGVWLCHDLRNAFHKVPRGRLVNILHQFLPAPIVSLVARLIARPQKRGIPQGLALSLLVVNLYLDHFLDKRWGRLMPGIPLLRYVDDLGFFCLDRVAAEQADKCLRAMLVPTGMPLKPSSRSPIRDLRAGEEAEWLGYRVQLLDDQTLSFRIRDKSWERLEKRLQTAQVQGLPMHRALATISGWLQAMGPCFDFEARDDALDRIVHIARSCEFGDLPSRERMLSLWRQGSSRFKRHVKDSEAAKQTAQASGRLTPSDSSGAKSSAPDEAPF